MISVVFVKINVFLFIKILMHGILAKFWIIVLIFLKLALKFLHPFINLPHRLAFTVNYTRTKLQIFLIQFCNFFWYNCCEFSSFFRFPIFLSFDRNYKMTHFAFPILLILWRKKLRFLWYNVRLKKGKKYSRMLQRYRGKEFYEEKKSLFWRRRR